MHLHSITLGAVPNGKTLPLLTQTLQVLPAENHYAVKLDFSSVQVKKSVNYVISASTTTLLM